MIYDNFFGFREEPFGVTPNPKFLYMSRKHEDALAHLRFGISENRGFVMLTGEIGSGKTTLIRYLLDNLLDTHTSLIINPMSDALELLKLINHDFGVNCSRGTQKELLDALNNFLLDAFSKDEICVLVIDEAQEMSIECLEFIRLLSNLETNTKKLLQVILVGQPELKKIVGSEPLKQLDQRIAVRYHLEPLDFNDTIIYINHRLKIAGGGMVAFPAGGIKHIHKYSRGIPRLINLACDRTLLLAFSEGKMKIDPGMIRNAIGNLGSPASKTKRDIFKPAIIGLLILVLIIMIAYRNLDVEEHYLQRLSAMLKGIATEGDFFVSDGIYMASKSELFESASVLNLLSTLGEKNLKSGGDINAELQKRGFSSCSIGSDLDKAIRFNMPCILYLRHSKMSGSVVLRWVVGDDAMIIDPKEGKNIFPIRAFKKDITDIKLVYKNRYNSSIGGVAALQSELKKRGLYGHPVTGRFGTNTKKALIKFQRSKGLKATGVLDDETAIMLSGREGMPGLTPE